MTLRHAILGLAGMALAGCAGLTGERPQASTATLDTASATVEAVDLDTREVRLRDDADGEVFTVTAGPEVRNLPQLEPGDRVTLEFYDEIAVAMADPADPGVESSVVLGRAPEGALPGGVAALSTSVVVQLVSYDADSRLATIRTPSGAIRTVTVLPELAAFAAQRRPGDRVAVTFTEALAVSIEEAA